jgi:hypothetical protein
VYKNEEYWCLHTYHGCAAIPLILHFTDLINSGILQKTQENLYHDLSKVFYDAYVHYDDQKVHPIKDFGIYFPKVVKNPSDYIM